MGIVLLLINAQKEESTRENWTCDRFFRDFSWRAGKWRNLVLDFEGLFLIVVLINLPLKIPKVNINTSLILAL